MLLESSLLESRNFNIDNVKSAQYFAHDLKNLLLSNSIIKTFKQVFSFIFRKDPK